MQVFHKADDFDDTNIKYAAISIMFSVEEFEEIDQAKNGTFQKFFEHLKFDHSDPTVPIIGFGDMMDQVDFEKRWIYKGSMNEPPCEQYVYWNILEGIYPIKIEEFEKFQKL